MSVCLCTSVQGLLTFCERDVMIVNHIIINHMFVAFRGRMSMLVCLLVLDLAFHSQCRLSLAAVLLARLPSQSDCKKKKKFLCQVTGSHKTFVSIFYVQSTIRTKTNMLFCDIEATGSKHMRIKYNGWTKNIYMYFLLYVPESYNPPFDIV